jgi:3-phenylpropionate/cinnamic acid dioxygenase small subunit
MSAPGNLAAKVARTDVEDFLYREADLLDSWRLNDWLPMFDEEAIYEVPTTDLPNGRAGEDLFIIADTMPVLRGRVTRLNSVNAFVESPKSRTRRMVTNVRITGLSGDTLEITANFHISRIRKGMTDTYIGRYDHTLRVLAEGDFRFRRRRAILDHDALRPQGKISIIL